MLRSAKLAIPPTALRLTVPDRVPPPGFAPMATVITLVAVATVFPRVSCTATCSAGLMVVPTTVGLGCTVNASLTAAPAVTSNALLVPAASPVAAAASV